MVQQELRCPSGDEVTLKSMAGTNRSSWNPDPSLKRLYEIIMAWPSLPLLFSRGAGELKTKKRAAPTKTKRRKRRKFGDEEDDDDEAYIPRGARKTGKWEWDPETRKREYVPPPVY